MKVPLEWRETPPEEVWKKAEYEVAAAGGGR